MSARPHARWTGTRPQTRTSGAGGALLVLVAILGASCSDAPISESSPSATTSSAAATSPATDETTETTNLQPPATEGPLATPQDLTLPPRVGVNQELIDAAWANDVQRSRELIAEGADVNHKDNTQQSAYLIATSEGYIELLDLTLDNGADVASLDGYDGTGLIRAAERGHARVVGRLLQTDIDVNHINNLGWTALHESIILGTGDERYADTVRLLVAGGADATLPPRDGTPPIELARVRGQDDVATTLKAALDAAPFDDANRMLLDAASSGDADRVAVALAAGADVEARDAKLRTPLLLAASDDHPSVVRLLVALGADPDALDDRHDTPWLVTGVTGSVDVAEILLSAEPDLAILNRFGGTSLIPAADRGHVDYVRWVLQTGIDVDHVNDLGWTALMEAVLLGDGSEPYQQIVLLLVAAGADTTIADRDGTTAAQHAASASYDEIARLLGDD